MKHLLWLLATVYLLGCSRPDYPAFAGDWVPMLPMGLNGQLTIATSKTGVALTESKGLASSFGMDGEFHAARLDASSMELRVAKPLNKASENLRYLLTLNGHVLTLSTKLPDGQVSDGVRFIRRSHSESTKEYELAKAVLGGYLNELPAQTGRGLGFAMPGTPSERCDKIPKELVVSTVKVLDLRPVGPQLRNTSKPDSAMAGGIAVVELDVINSDLQVSGGTRLAMFEFWVLNLDARRYLFRCNLQGL